VRAAEYVRMSTDHQKYSTENQSDAIRQYAEARGIEIVRTYADAGKSGLKIEGRDALRQLIEDVEAGTTDFTLVLVYDVSRWGRFQDADESAYRRLPDVCCAFQRCRNDPDFADHGAQLAGAQQAPAPRDRQQHRGHRAQTPDHGGAS